MDLTETQQAEQAALVAKLDETRLAAIADRTESAERGVPGDPELHSAFRNAQVALDVWVARNVPAPLPPPTFPDLDDDEDDEPAAEEPEPTA